MNRSAIATPASISVHPYRYATVRRGLNPIRAIRWWKWFASAFHGARRYLIRFATTKLVSRNGTARITSGATRATTAFVFSEPSTVTIPSR